ncbi:putative late blight resistance protein homolog R1B-16 [Helianthus annuus]|nr:putative late blight resistance protein homolog R1B-16 [Helianthus annuus]
MAYAGIQMFMDKLNQLINCDDIPSINNPEIMSERPQLQLLYEELGSMIQTLFIDQHQDLHDLQKVGDLKKRFIDAAEEAQYNVDLFLSGVHIRNTTKDFPTSEDFSPSLNLDDVRRSLKSVEVELMSMIMDNMKVGSSRRRERTLNQSAPVSISRNSLGSKKLLDEIFVGIDRDAELIRDKLVEDQKKLNVVSIVGMGGIGKTTLATKVFNDGYVRHHFHVRVWVTVSQTYDKRAVLIQILESICAPLDLEKTSDSRLRELVHKHLFGKRYLMVMDDVWQIETWDNLKSFFPHDNNRSRILLTSRLTEVAKHANLDGLTHHLGYLNNERSWELLCQKVFQGNECPEWSIKRGMQIVEHCQGLPLAVVVIAGVLAREAWSEKFWEEIAKRTGSYIVGDQNGCMETLGLSYNHLPLHLRECFLYLGGFPEDFKFEVKRLMWLWVAEGFIQKDGNRRLEDIGEGYLMDLVDRNLVIVDRWKSVGSVKACKVHDLVRELCLKKAKEERFILKTNTSQLDQVKKRPYKVECMFTNNGIMVPSAENCRSVLIFGKKGFLVEDIAKQFRSFVLLRVLKLHKCRLNDFPKAIKLLVHLRYLEIWKESEGFPSSICNLWGLQTLIYVTEEYSVDLPSNISNLVNLRHLRGQVISLPSIEKPMNLQTISYISLGEGVANFQKCFPNIKEHTCCTCSDEQNDFKSLTFLEKLSLVGDFERRVERITFPTSLKTLTLEKCRLPWSEMSIIQSLPNLQHLKLHPHAFEGSCWNTNGQEFPQLKLLNLEWLNIKVWEAYSESFPCLRQLQITNCRNLEEIPLEIGEIPTLELIQIRGCRDSVIESVRRIEEEQGDLGNYDLKIDIIERER